MIQKEKVTVSAEQKYEYAKMMVEDGYSTRQIQDICGASSSAVQRWRKKYLDEQNGQTPVGYKAITPEQQRIQELEKQLARAKRDIDILKKASALFIQNS